MDAILKHKLSSGQTWLENVVMELRPWFKQAGYKVPDNVFIEPKHLGPSSTGQHAPAVFDFNHEIFISPTTQNDPEIIGIVVHELIHAVLPLGSGHGSDFRKAAIAVGLKGRMVCTTAGPRLQAWARDFISRRGPYRGPRFDPRARAATAMAAYSADKVK